VSWKGAQSLRFSFSISIATWNCSNRFVASSHLAAALSFLASMSSARRSVEPISIIRFARACVRLRQNVRICCRVCLPSPHIHPGSIPRTPTLASQSFSPRTPVRSSAAAITSYF